MKKRLQLFCILPSRQFQALPRVLTELAELPTFAVKTGSGEEVSRRGLRQV